MEDIKHKKNLYLNSAYNEEEKTKSVIKTVSDFNGFDIAVRKDGVIKWRIIG